MDLSNAGAYGRAQSVSGGRVLEGRPSVDAATQRLQKQRSEAGMYARSQTQALPTEPGTSTARGQRAGEGDGMRTRRGSIRNAMRRLFGRRSRESEQAIPGAPTSSQQGFQEAGPTALPTQPEIPEHLETETTYTERMVSAPPMMLPTTLTSRRTRMPNAVEFPQSSRLKPLNLGNPFDAPGSQLRRRKTEPSIQAQESDVTAHSGSNESSEDVTGPLKNRSRDKSKAAGRKTVRDKRKSRSADDLVRLSSDTDTEPRKRSEEIQYWRDSFQGSVLQTGGVGLSFARHSLDEPKDAWATVGTSGAHENVSRPRAKTPSHQRGLSEDIVSPSTAGTELARELEDRVAKLEAGLQSFRGQLAQVTAHRNRRTVVIGGPLDNRVARQSERTASMLALDLQTDIAPSAYHYDYRRTLRPSTSPSNIPKTPIRTATESVPPPATPINASREMDDPFVEASQPADEQAPSPRPEPKTQTRDTLQPSFRALYEMLSDERAARRRLERRMERLHTELTSLHHQVSERGNLQSQRSSFAPMTDAMAGSSRLQAFLRGTDTSPTSVGASQPYRAMNLPSAEQSAMVSRFSGSESERGTAHGHEDSETYASYRTPEREQSWYLAQGQSRSGGGMF